MLVNLLRSVIVAHMLVLTRGYLIRRALNTRFVPLRDMAISKAVSKVPSSSKLHRLPRILVEQPLMLNHCVSLSEEQSHYITNVMRRRIGEYVRIFNQNDGEHLAELQIEGGRRSKVAVHIVQQLRQPHMNNSYRLPCRLLISPIKKAKLKFLLEKVTELGIAELVPIQTQNCQFEWGEKEAYGSVLIESSEQCERLSIPTVQEPTTLQKLLRTRKEAANKGDAGDNARDLLVCVERASPGAHESTNSPTMSLHTAKPLLGEVQRIVSKYTANGSKWSQPFFDILIGPEGGFTESEIQELLNSPGVTLVSLGPLVLRSETAAICALSTVGCAVDMLRHLE